MERIGQVLVIGQLGTYGRLLTKAFPQAAVRSISSVRDLPTHLYNALLVYTDGLNVSPKLYGADRYPTESIADRDAREVEIRTATIGCRALGIGRGSHFLWVMAGGSILQFVAGHRHNHKTIDSETGQVVETHSFHTQGVEYGTGPKAKVLAFNLTSNSQTVYDHNSKQSVVTLPTKELPLMTVEAWTTLDTLGIQFRPDLSSCPVEGRSLFYKYVKQVFQGE